MIMRLLTLQLFNLLLNIQCFLIKNLINHLATFKCRIQRTSQTWIFSATSMASCRMVLGSPQLQIETGLEPLSWWQWHNLFLLEQHSVSFQRQFLNVREIAGRETDHLTDSHFIGFQLHKILIICCCWDDRRWTFWFLGTAVCHWEINLLHRYTNQCSMYLGRWWCIVFRSFSTSNLKSISTMLLSALGPQRVVTDAWGDGIPIILICMELWLSFYIMNISKISRECQGLTLGFGGFLWFFQGFLNNKPNFRSNVIFYRD